MAGLSVRAVRVGELGDPPRLRVEDVPDPVAGAGETLVRVTAAAVAHLDRTVASGAFATHPPLPYVPGTDGAGVVVASARHPVGATVRIRGGGVGIARDGTWAELVAVPDDAVHPAGAVGPAGAGAAPEVVATFFSPAATALLALTDVGGLQAGEAVAVTGASGAVGSLAVQLARRAGAGAVVGIVGSETKRAAVPDTATTVVVGRGAAAADGLRAAGGVDLLVDTVGGDGLAGLLGAVRPGGRAALVGYTAGTRLEVGLPALLQADVRLLPVNLIRRADRAAQVAPALLADLAAGRLALRVTTFPLDEAAEALDALAAGRSTGRVALVP